MFADVRRVEVELATIEAEMADEAKGADELDRLVDRQAELFETMERLDGWDVDRRIDTALTKLGYRQPSGGWRNRASLGKILLENPQVLLFDEPTNYLDVVGVEWSRVGSRAFMGPPLLSRMIEPFSTVWSIESSR